MPFIMTVHYDLTDFRVFVNVVEATSLTRGAERSCLSVPATSNRIKNLEDGLGIKLLERSSQGISLTAAGKTYLAHARTVLGQLDMLTGDLQQYAAGIKGRLVLLANTTAVTEYLPPVLGQYLKDFPDVQVDMRERLSDDIVRSVREGAADLGIISGSVVTDDLETLPFVSSELVVIAPKGHPVVANKATDFAQTLEYDHVSLSEGSAIHLFLAQKSGELHRPMAIRIQVSSYDAMFRMVEAGAGIAVIPLACYERLRGTADLDVCRLTAPWAIRHFQICAREFDGLCRFASDFVAAMKDFYAQPEILVSQGVTAPA